jgi:hypothetical protein
MEGITDDAATSVRELRRFVGGLSVALARQFRLVSVGDNGHIFSDWASSPVAPVIVGGSLGQLLD